MQPGDELAGRYRLQERLGHGGMGEVWRGTDQQLNRGVAIKLLLNQQDGPESVLRFQREAEITASLQHPGITVVHDIGRHDGHLFIVMELLHGTDLGRALADAPTGLPIDEAISLTIQVTDALAAAHGLGIVHRDLKPANLFLLASGRLKICDFGIARAADSFNVTLTPTGQSIGTPAYMSPEQWRGEQVDERSDLYSLACVLHALLTGQPPFPARQPYHVLMHQHLNVAPAGPRAFRPDTPSQLNELVLDLLAKNPANRPATAKLVAAALGTITEPPPTEISQAQTVADIDSTPATRPLPLDDTQQITSNRTNEVSRTRTQKDLAQPVAGTDSPHATRLLTDAERLARTITNEHQRANALIAIAKVTATTDPGHARRLLNDAAHIASVSTREGTRAEVMAGVAEVLATTDPERSAQLLTDAERLTRTITDEGEQVKALTTIAKALTNTDPDRAEEIARTLTYEDQRTPALTEVAQAVADTDPDRAERLARTITHEDGRARALADIAKVVAVTDLDHASRLLDDAERLARTARTITPESSRGSALTYIAMVMVGTDPDRAAQLLTHAERLIPTHESGRALALVDVAEVMARIDPSRAVQLLDDLERLVPTVPRRVQSFVLLGITRTMARIDPDRAVQITHTISNARLQGLALHEIANTVAETDPGRAEQIARTIATEYDQTLAMVDIANVRLKGQQDRTSQARR